MSEKSALKTFLWYQDDLDGALAFYKELFGDVQVRDENSMNGKLFTASFTIFGHELIGMSIPGGDIFNDSISLSLQVDGQAETDRIWEGLTREGKAGNCGWCKDKWGVAWQVTPIQMGQYLGNPDPDKAQQNWGILRKMGKIQLSDFIV